MSWHSARSGMDENPGPAVSKIIPGNWGKAGSGWLVRPLQAPGRKARKAEAGFTGSTGGVRALPVSRKWNRAARHDEKPFRAELSNTGWFRARVNRSHSGECMVATVCQHGTERSGGGIPIHPPAKSAERRTKRASGSGKDPGRGPTR
jgi:hypothetical protein